MMISYQTGYGEGLSFRDYPLYASQFQGLEEHPNAQMQFYMPMIPNDLLCATLNCKIQVHDAHTRRLRYLFHPSRTQYRFPSSPSAMTNLSHLASRPAPTTTMLLSLVQPIIPLDGRTPSGSGEFNGEAPPYSASSPISK